MEQKKRFSVMSIDDTTNSTDAFCGNITGMCCNQYTMPQDEILKKTYDAYGYQVGQDSSIYNPYASLLGVINESPEKTFDYGTDTETNKTTGNDFKQLPY